ncbi:MAG: hypothetical protein K5799_15190 [Erythrobacter sp.]|nr:hypothetical protein [Erythrobacter sp.]
MIHKSTLKGYILEELLAKLVQDSGYMLLVHMQQDTWALGGGGNGLRVHGRGADHQVDVLGELNVPVQLALPIRLFLEAKCRADKSDLRDVRNAVGTIDDVNQYYTMQDASRTPPRRRYQYKYALASTSGFTPEAVYYAITHQLSLVDLSGPSAKWLRDMVDRVAMSLLQLAGNSSAQTFPVGQMREALRRALGTHPDINVDIDAEDSLSGPAKRAHATPRPASGLNVSALAQVCADAAAELPGRLLIAWTASPFLVFVQPTDDDLADLPVEGGSDEPRVRARLEFVGPTPGVGQWRLRAIRDGLATEPSSVPPRRPNDAAFRLLIPPELEPFVIAVDQPELRGAPSRDQPEFRFQVAPKSTIRFIYEPAQPVYAPREEEYEGSRGAAWDHVRESLWIRGTNLDREVGDEDGDEGDSVPWPEHAYRALIERLEAEQAPQARIIEIAASSGGVITREDVYTFAHRARDRTLRGFTKPAMRIARDLIAEEQLHPEAAAPLLAKYRGGVKASHFEVPLEFTEYVDPTSH